MSQKSVSPKNSKLFSKQRPLRVVVLGLPSVGKTALTVRFITKRFIGEYDPTLEKKYAFHTEVDGDSVSFDVLDTAGQTAGCEGSVQQEEYLRWADAFLLVYCVTDRCSLDECTRLKFLITHAKKSRKASSQVLLLNNDLPIVLVGNKNDLEPERMVSVDEGRRRGAALACCSFHDISVRESYEEAKAVFVELYRHCRQATLSRKSYRRLQRDAESLDHSPPPSVALRKRDRGTVIGCGVSMDTFDVALGDMGRVGERERTRPRSYGNGVDPDSVPEQCTRSTFIGDGAAEPVKEGLKRKESMSRRFIRKVIPVRSLSAPKGDLSVSKVCNTDSSDG